MNIVNKFYKKLIPSLTTSVVERKEGQKTCLLDFSHFVKISEAYLYEKKLEQSVALFSKRIALQFFTRANFFSFLSKKSVALLTFSRKDPPWGFLKSQAFRKASCKDKLRLSFRKLCLKREWGKRANLDSLFSKSLFFPNSPERKSEKKKSYAFLS